MHEPELVVSEGAVTNQELNQELLAGVESGASALSTMLDELWSTSMAVEGSNIASHREFDSEGERLPDVTSLMLYMEDGSYVSVGRENVPDGSQRLTISFRVPRIQQIPTERGYSTELVYDKPSVVCGMSQDRWGIVESSGFGQDDSRSAEQQFIDSATIVQQELARREPIDRKTPEGKTKYLSEQSPIDLAYRKSNEALKEQSGKLVERPLTKEEERVKRREAKAQEREDRRAARAARREERKRRRDADQAFSVSPEGRQQTRENASVARGFIFSPLVGLNRAVKVRQNRQNRDSK